MLNYQRVDFGWFRSRWCKSHAAIVGFFRAQRMMFPPRGPTECPLRLTESWRVDSWPRLERWSEGKMYFFVGGKMEQNGTNTSWSGSFEIFWANSVLLIFSCGFCIVLEAPWCGCSFGHKKHWCGVLILRWHSSSYHRFADAADAGAERPQHGSLGRNSTNFGWTGYHTYG